MSVLELSGSYPGLVRASWILTSMISDLLGIVHSVIDEIGGSCEPIKDLPVLRWVGIAMCSHYKVLYM